MDEKLEYLVSLYDLEVTKTYKIKGMTALSTNRGEMVVKAYQASEARAETENAIKKLLRDKGFCGCDPIIENLEGKLISYNQYGNPMVIKELVTGNECNLLNREQVEIATMGLADLHNSLKAVEFDEETNEKFSVKDIRDIRDVFARHLRELGRVRKYIVTGRRTSEFEIELVNSFDQYFEQAREANEMINESWYDKLMENEVDKVNIYHGCYNQHSIIFNPLVCCSKEISPLNQISLTNFERSGRGVQVVDLYQLIRKTMEKTNWDVDYGIRIVEAYNGINRLSTEELRLMVAMVKFPEKFWKLADQYMNSRKSWLKNKNLAKLLALNEQEKAKANFTEALENIIY